MKAVASITVPIEEVASFPGLHPDYILKSGLTGLRPCSVFVATSDAVGDFYNLSPLLVKEILALSSDAVFVQHSRW